MHILGKASANSKKNSAVQRSESNFMQCQHFLYLSLWAERDLKIRLTCCVCSVLRSVYSSHPNVMQHIYSVLLLTPGYGISNSINIRFHRIQTFAKGVGGRTRRYSCHLANRKCHLARISEPLRRKDDDKVANARYSGTSHYATAYSLTFPPSGPWLQSHQSTTAAA